MSRAHKLMVTLNTFFVSVMIAFVTFALTMPGTPERPVSRQELASATGKDNRPCMVAIEGTVYEISGSLYWQKGRHLPSEGLAYCGADLTKVLPRSPHGTRVLKLIDKIGPLTD